MDTFFGKTFSCTCGRTHSILPRRSLYSPGAAGELAEACAELTPGRRVVVLTDARTRQAAGSDVAGAFARAGWTVREIVVPDPAAGHSSGNPQQPDTAEGPPKADATTPVCDALTREALEPQIGEADLICPVGAGVISDLGKWIASDRGLPYVTFATAASMNGYASANIAPTIGGVKRLLDGKAPQFVASSPAVLAAAPYELTASGLGDVLAKSVSSADWYCNHLLFGDYFCERSVRLIEEIEPLYMKKRGLSTFPLQGLHEGESTEGKVECPLFLPQDAVALEALYSALLLTGVAMTMAGTSAPASGGEHLISHWLDMMSLVDGAGHDLHGRQVGVGTILACELYRRVLAVESPALTAAPDKINASAWGPAESFVEVEYTKKLPRLREARLKLSAGNAWDELRRSLRPLVRPPEVIRDCLAAASAAHKAEHIGCDKRRLLSALTHAHEIRSRFTILDLARLTGVLPATAEEIIEQWM